jgi:hypothetical protein
VAISEGLQVLVGGDRDLSQLVVHLVGDATPFLLLSTKQLAHQVLKLALTLL